MAAVFDYHWRLQSCLIEGLEGLEDIIFLQLEHLAEDMAKYGDVWGDRDMSLLSSRRQSNSYDAVVEEGEMAHLSADEVIAFKDANGSFPKKDAFLNDELRGLLREVYAKDYERFGIYS